ncbi:hypothetical protein MPQ_2003 [Methylovorus sp. MP688]|nr:hypothetical protein MPQ_2003 [Methylovorus sp. MP688]
MTIMRPANQAVELPIFVDARPEILQASHHVSSREIIPN